MKKAPKSVKELRARAAEQGIEKLVTQVAVITGAYAQAVSDEAKLKLEEELIEPAIYLSVLLTVRDEERIKARVAAEVENASPMELLAKLADLLGGGGLAGIGIVQTNGKQYAQDPNIDNPLALVFVDNPTQEQRLAIFAAADEAGIPVFKSTRAGEDVAEGFNYLGISPRSGFLIGSRNKMRDDMRLVTAEEYIALLLAQKGQLKPGPFGVTGVVKPTLEQVKAIAEAAARAGMEMGEGIDTGEAAENGYVDLFVSPDTYMIDAVTDVAGITDLLVTPEQFIEQINALAPAASLEAVE